MRSTTNPPITELQEQFIHKIINSPLINSREIGTEFLVWLNSIISILPFVGGTEAVFKAGLNGNIPGIQQIPANILEPILTDSSVGTNLLLNATTSREFLLFILESYYKHPIFFGELAPIYDAVKKTQKTSLIKITITAASEISLSVVSAASAAAFAVLAAYKAPWAVLFVITAFAALHYLGTRAAIERPFKFFKQFFYPDPTVKISQEAIQLLQRKYIENLEKVTSPLQRAINRVEVPEEVIQLFKNSPGDIETSTGPQPGKIIDDYFAKLIQDNPAKPTPWHQAAFTWLLYVGFLAFSGSNLGYADTTVLGINGMLGTNVFWLGIMAFMPLFFANTIFGLQNLKQFAAICFNPIETLLTGPIYLHQHPLLSSFIIIASLIMVYFSIPLGAALNLLAEERIFKLMAPSLCGFEPSTSNGSEILTQCGYGSLVKFVQLYELVGIMISTFFFNFYGVPGALKYGFKFGEFFLATVFGFFYSLFNKNSYQPVPTEETKEKLNPIEQYQLMKVLEGKVAFFKAMSNESFIAWLVEIKNQAREEAENIVSQLDDASFLSLKTRLSSDDGNKTIETASTVPSINLIENNDSTEHGNSSASNNEGGNEVQNGFTMVLTNKDGNLISINQENFSICQVIFAEEGKNQTLCLKNFQSAFIEKFIECRLESKIGFPFKALFPGGLDDADNLTKLVTQVETLQKDGIEEASKKAQAALTCSNPNPTSKSTCFNCGRFFPGSHDSAVSGPNPTKTEEIATDTTEICSLGNP